MNLSIHHEPQSQNGDYRVDDDYHVNQSMVQVPAPNFIPTADSFEKKEQSWFAISQIPTDLSIQVQDITFYTHKYPLISKCGYFGRIDHHHQSPPGSNSDLKLDNFPGGPETFESILKFCYGIPINLNPNNVAALRCASELLEMTEALEDGNLVTKTEAFFTFVVLSSWRDSVTVLKSCETLSPWAENLQIVRRCCDSIAWKISRESNTSTIGEIINEEKWWFDDLTTLRIDHFTRIVTALKAKGMEPEIIGACIMQYGNRWLPSIKLERELNYGKSELQWNVTSGRSSDKGDTNINGQTKEQRLLVESIVSMLPPQKEAVSCKFLLKMLRMAMLYSASPALVSELEKRVGLVLETAHVNDLLIPHYGPVDYQGSMLNSNEEHTMHNIDVVQRILEYFMLYEQQQQQQQQRPEPLAVGKLVDNYLAEIARDPKLQVIKFIVLAQSLPENARSCDDGIYRAIDIYLKAHPTVSDHERRRLCKVMDCGKLSLDACAHAAHNDRLPLRTMIQVLFSEQVKIRASIQGRNDVTVDNSEQESNNWSATNREVIALKIELETVKRQMEEIHMDYSELQQDQRRQNMKRRNSSVWKVGWAKIRRSALFPTIKVDGEEITDEMRSRNSLNRMRQSIP